MSNQTPNQKFSPEKLGFVPELILKVRLIVRLMGDQRVSPVLKLMPVAAMLYWFIPTDLIPLIPLDDAAVLYIGGMMFIELCPPEVVEEHMKALRAETPGMGQRPSGPESVIDAEFRDVGSGRPGDRQAEKRDEY